ncbi:MAG TPA: endonuclease/exonuclease/phosphatase family protein [Chitinophagaceae bacterium]|nr:endonuclease/exonuclease/phosphatase family protein [Chitinophagaceae bacterium]
MIRKFFRRFFIWLNIIVCAVYLFACLAPFISTASWPFFGFLSLALPYLVILLIFSMFFWLIIKPLYAFLPILVLLAGFKQLSVLFAFHPGTKFSAAKAAGDIRIVSWNVGNMYGLSNNADKKKHNRTEIAEAILKLQADVVCLQEFNNSTTRGEDADNIGLFTSIYPYCYFSKDVNKENGYYQYGSIIFSKQPFTDSGRIQYPGRPESLIYADVPFAADTICIFTSHLQSFKFNKEDYADIDNIKHESKQALASSKSLFQKMSLAFAERGKQAFVVRNMLDSCPRPNIMCGDFNDVPGSYTYFHIRGNRQDAFLLRNFGVGSTYSSLAPTLRIDYIMPDKHFTVHQFDMVDEALSDHVMLVSDVSLKK